MRAQLLLLVGLTAMGAAPPLEIPLQLPGTRALALPGDWREEQRRQILRYLDRKREAARGLRGSRAELRRMLGLSRHDGVSAAVSEGGMVLAALTALCSCRAGAPVGVAKGSRSPSRGKGMGASVRGRRGGEAAVPVGGIGGGATTVRAVRVRRLRASPGN